MRATPASSRRCQAVIAPDARRAVTNVFGIFNRRQIVFVEFVGVAFVTFADCRGCKGVTMMVTPPLSVSHGTSNWESSYPRLLRAGLDRCSEIMDAC